MLPPDSIEAASRFAHVHSRATLFLEAGDVSDMVAVTMGGGDDLDVADLEAELLDAGLHQVVRSIDTGVDQDVAFICGDEIGGKIVGADVVDVADDLEAGERRHPFLVRDWLNDAPGVLLRVGSDRCQCQCGCEQACRLHREQPPRVVPRHSRNAKVMDRGWNVASV